MIVIKNNPFVFLDKSGIDPKLLSADSREGLELFKDTMTDFEIMPNDENLKKQVEEIGKSVIEILEKDIKRIKGEAVESEQENEKHQVKKHQSKKTIERTDRTFDDLELCRQRLRDDRRQKVESGEIAKPKKRI